MRQTLSFLFLTLATLSFTPSAQAEDRAGFLIGANIADLSTDPDIDAGADSNLMLAGYAEFELNPQFFIEPQFRYIEKGADVSALVPGDQADVSRTLKYFEVPLLFKWKFREGEAFRPYAFIGPSLAFKVGDSTTVTPRSSGVPINGNFNNDSVRTIDFAAEVGGGAEFFFTDEFSIRLGAAYSLGLLDVNETPNNWKTRGLQLFAGAGFAY